MSIHVSSIAAGRTDVNAMQVSAQIDATTTPDQFDALRRRYFFQITAVDGVKGWNILHRAVSSGNTALIRHIVDLGRREGHNLVDDGDAQGSAPLLFAVNSHKHEVVKTLLELGAKANVCNQYRQTPLSIASSDDDAAMAKLLMKAGAANIGTLDAAGPTWQKGDEIELSQSARVTACLTQATALINAGL